MKSVSNFTSIHMEIYGNIGDKINLEGHNVVESFNLKYVFLETMVKNVYLLMRSSPSIVVRGLCNAEGHGNEEHKTKHLGTVVSKRSDYRTFWQSLYTT